MQKTKNKKSFIINVAGIGFSITVEKNITIYNRLQEIFKNFISLDKKSSYHIKIYFQKNGKELKFTKNKKDLKIITPLKIIKNNKLLNLFIDKIIIHIRDIIVSNPKIVLIHAAGCSKKNKGYLFLGPSKSGKTTITKLLKNYKILGDDKILLRCTKKNFYIFPFPALSFECKKFKIKLNYKVYLKKIFFLKKSKSVKFRKVSKANAFAIIFNSIKEVSNISKVDINKVFKISKNLASSIPVFKMYFKKDNSFLKYIDKL